MTEAFVLQFSITCHSHGNNHDDLLAVMQLFLSQHSNISIELAQGSVEKVFLSEIYRVLGINVDSSGDLQFEQMFKNQMIQRCLSMQMSLGYRGEKKHRSLPAKVAWTILNLRFASLIFAFAFKNPPNMTVAEGDKKLGIHCTSHHFMWLS